MIYFAGNDIEDSPGGYAYSRRDDRGSMVEADLYINVPTVELYGPHLLEAKQVFEVGGNHIYAVVDLICTTILHEIGHALGLQHVPVSGNIMSYNYLPCLKNLWGPAMMAEALEQYEYDSSSFVLRGPFAEFTYTSGDDQEYWHIEVPPRAQQQWMV